MRSKLKFIIPIALLLVLGGAYKMVLAKPAKLPKPHVDGSVYVLPKEFLIVAGRHHDPCEGEELDLLRIVHVACRLADVLGYDVTRPLVTRGIDEITDVSSKDLIDHKGRSALRARVLKGILAQTDVKAKAVLFTDVAVQ